VAARGERRGRRRLWQHVALGGLLGASEAIGAVGRRRARAGARAQGGGNNGAVELEVARRGEKGRLLYALKHSVTMGDGEEMVPPCYGGSGDTRTAAAPPTDRRSLAHARTAA
jgi:hypothetical protein